MYFATAPLVKFKDVQKVSYLRKSFVIGDLYKAKIDLFLWPFFINNGFIVLYSEEYQQIRTWPSHNGKYNLRVQLRGKQDRPLGSRSLYTDIFKSSVHFAVSQIMQAEASSRMVFSTDAERSLCKGRSQTGGHPAVGQMCQQRPRCTPITTTAARWLLGSVTGLAAAGSWIAL